MGKGDHRQSKLVFDLRKSFAKMVTTCEATEGDRQGDVRVLEETRKPYCWILGPVFNQLDNKIGSVTSLELSDRRN